MELKKFQKDVINDLNRYCELLNTTNSVSKAFADFWDEKNVRVGMNGIPDYKNTIENTPHVCFKVPTGGGKTFLACSSLKTIFNNLPEKRAKLVLWLVPSEAILSQTLKNLSNPDHPYHQKIASDFNGRMQVYSKQQVLDGQQFNPTTVNEQLCIVVMSFDSFRIKNKEGRKVYQENGNLQQFSKFMKNPENLIEGIDETALIQVFNQISPVVIVDESHHTTGELSVEMLKNLNPCFILDLTATPRENSNIISYVDAMQLKAENMVKLPVILYNRPSQEEVIADALDLRNRLEEFAKKEPSGRYIRPIVLFQAQPRQAENKETFEKLKKRLVESGIPEDEIAIKTADINELKNINLQSPECRIKYIVTVNALKEGWDCPFAYILASLANRTSTVDVEQILGRVLRLPYTQQNENKFLNLSYVLTSSNDFHTTIAKVIEGLNDAGFSEKEFRVAEETPAAMQKTEQREFGTVESGSNTKELVADNEDDLPHFDSEELKKIIKERENTEDSSLDSMLESAGTSSDDYNEAIKEAQNESAGNLPLEVRSKVNLYRMYEQYEKEALSLKIPQFFIKTSADFNFEIFKEIGEEYQNLLTKEDLSEDFTLKDKDTKIDFDSATESIVAIDVQKNERPKYRYVSERERAVIKQFFKNLPPESRIEQCKFDIKRVVEKIDCISNQELTSYIDRIIDNMNSDELAAMENNIFGYAARIKTKIEKLLYEYRVKKFKELLETGDVECRPYFKFESEINPGNPFDQLSKSLYKAEQRVNDFELTVIEKVAALPNIKWWHRNIDRIEFCINGFLNHYPDFIVMTENGKIIMIETKGDFYSSNDDSRAKAELGKIWQSKAGDKYRYYMVSEEHIASNPNATSLDDFMNIIKKL